VFPNQGVLMRPFQILKIVDRQGNLLEENRPQPREAIRADTAYVMTNLMRGVVVRGTGAAAAALDWPLGGKTGTTNDYTDAWFTGFDPNVTVGVWIGHDDKKPLGPSETGAVAALPIWTEFMKAYIGSMEFDAPPQEGREAKLATLYIRPHQLEIEHEDRGEAQFRARVAHVNPAGPLVKVDLVAEWGDPVRVELSQERYRALALEEGKEVFVRPKDMSLFTE
jgi:membrane peptidoglycan carboxypeptidase